MYACVRARARVCINYEYLFGKRLCVQWTGTGNNNYVILSDYTRERKISQKRIGANCEQQQGGWFNKMDTLFQNMPGSVV